MREIISIAEIQERTETTIVKAKEREIDRINNDMLTAAGNGLHYAYVEIIYPETKTALLAAGYTVEDSRGPASKGKE